MCIFLDTTASPSEQQGERRRAQGSSGAACRHARVRAHAGVPESHEVLCILFLGIVRTFSHPPHVRPPVCARTRACFVVVGYRICIRTPTQRRYLLERVDALLVACCSAGCQKVRTSESQSSESQKVRKSESLMYSIVGYRIDILTPFTCPHTCVRANSRMPAGCQKVVCILL